MKVMTIEDKYNEENNLDTEYRVIKEGGEK